MNKLFCKNRNEWRKWLEQNNESQNEVWLVYYKKHTKKPTVIYNEAVEEALCYGWIDSIVKRVDDKTYMQKYTPRNDNSIWSLVNKDRVEKLIKEGKMTNAGLKKVEVAKANGQWEKAYSSQKDIEIPDYLKKAFKENKTAWNNFSKFAKSYQNNYIGWVVSAKRVETVEKRVKIVIERSEKNLKPGMV